MNQVFFERVLVHTDETITAELNEPFATITSQAVRASAHEKSTTPRSGARTRTSLLEASDGANAPIFCGKGLSNDTAVHLSATNQKRWERALVAARTEINRGKEPEKAAPPVGVRALRQRQVRLSGEQKAKLAAEYAAGGNIRQLATSWGVSREAVRSALRQQHVPVRQVVLTERQLEDAASLKTRGWSLNRLGALYGVDPKTMKARLQARVERTE
ncbi:hypothetical protein [Rathayibacter tritici]|uniref:hypothetical protein n=1 Tax=Rathayibacter tritici TaxID=33888 RepID=UPI0012F8CEC0|nr:hypothetical protein [Rathayibacter tritici]